MKKKSFFLTLPLSIVMNLTFAGAVLASEGAAEVEMTEAVTEVAEPMGPPAQEEIPLDTSKHEHTYRLAADSYEATDTTGGYRHYRCSVCGDDYSYTTDPMVYAENLKTGEEITLDYAMNPYLPNYEFMPDNELHVFWSREDSEWRVYAVGSHDMKMEGWCGSDVHCWSAPVYDVTDWRYEGVLRTLPTGNYAACDFDYDLQTDQIVLFVNSNEQRRLWTNGNSVPDSYFDTPLSEEGIPGIDDDAGFDPAIYIDDDGSILTIFDNSDGGTKHARLSKINDERTEIEWYCDIQMAEGEPNREGFEPNHFEASTIDLVEVDGHSYWVIQYSMRTDWQQNREDDPEYQKFVDGEGWSWWPLVYIYSDPDLSIDELANYTSWHWGGVIGDNAGFYRQDMETGEVTEHDTPVYCGGNNHGGLAYINGQWYVSNHRHTSYNAGRQGYLRTVDIYVSEDGRLVIESPEYTSSVGESIDAYQTWPAYMACHLWPTVFSEKHTQTLFIDTPLRDAPEDYWSFIYDDPDYALHRSPVTGIENGAEVGFKYLNFGEEASSVSMSVLVAQEEGYVDGIMNVYLDAPSEEEGGTRIGSISVNGENIEAAGVTASGSDGLEWSTLSASMDQEISGIHGVYFIFESEEEGNICKLDEFTFEKIAD